MLHADTYTKLTQILEDISACLFLLTDATDEKGSPDWRAEKRYDLNRILEKLPEQITEITPPF